jgi:parallel beta-helix repeat protein
LPAPAAIPPAWIQFHRDEEEPIPRGLDASHNAGISQLRKWGVEAVEASQAAVPRDFQGLLDHPQALGRTVVEVPVGYWRVDRTLIIHANTVLRGTDAQHSCLVVTRPGRDLIALTGSHIRVENLCLIGPGGIAKDGGNGPGRGIVNLDKTVSLRGIAIHGLWITNLGGTAVELYGNWNARLSDITIDGNAVHRVGGHGIYAGFIDDGRIGSNFVVDSALGGLLKGDGAIDAEGGTRITIVDNWVEANLAAGIQGNNLYWSTVSNNVASHTHAGPGFSLWNCSHLTVSGNQALGNDNEGYYWSILDWLPAGGSFLTVDSNVAEGNGLSGFYIARHSGVEFINNLALDNNQRDAGHSGLLLHFSNEHVHVSANTFVNLRAGQGQQYGVGTDQQTLDLSVDRQNTFVHMRSGNEQVRLLTRSASPSP